MAGPSRYRVSGDEDAASVLKNKLGITDLKTLEDTETLLLEDTYAHFFELLEEGRFIINLELVFKIHNYFLDTLYSWAGRPRTVEISKGSVMFCASAHIESELKNFEQTFTENVPTEEDTAKAASYKLALIHCELNAVHPFREGNGRTIRLLLDLLTVNAGFSAIDYQKTSKKNYIQACVKGMVKDYSPMQEIIYAGLSRP